MIDACGKLSVVRGIIPVDYRSCCKSNGPNTGAVMGFKIGDTVQLKSGSPRMTVTIVGKTADGREVVECAWFDGMQRQNSSFPPDALRDSPVSKQARPT